jgi:ABC-2 type transport system ATP-binding protein
VIELQSVTQIYRSLLPPRPVHALRDLTLTFAAGEVVGIAGPNGAGKSTLLGLVLGFLRPTRGSISVRGESPRRFVERQGIAYLPELIAIPPWWRVTGALRRFAVLSGLPAPEREARVAEAVEALGLDEHRNKKVRQLSKGNRQRVGIAQALLSDADVVVLDEPTHGLDPLWRTRFRDLVLSLRRPDRTILIASHNLHELEQVADRVAILDHGRLTQVADLTEPAAGASAPRQYLMEFSEDVLEMTVLLPSAKRVSEEGEPPRWEVEGTLSELNAVLEAALERGATVRGFYPKRTRLETAFHEAVGDS